MFTWKRFLLASVALLFLLVLTIMLILPGIVLDHANRWVTEETGRKLKVESLRINPFSLSAEISKLELSEQGQDNPFVSFELMRVSLSITSLYHRAFILDELRLNQPKIYLQKQLDGQFNFSDLIPPPSADGSEKKPAEPVRFSVNNISINNGSIDFIDNSLEPQAHHKIRDLTLVLPSIGNLPYMIENPAKPVFHAVVNNAPFDLEGKVKPFTTTQEMEFDLLLEQIDIPYYLGYVPVELPVDIRNGKLNLELNILYRISKDSGGELELSGRADLISLDIWDRLQQQLFFLPILKLELASSQPLKQQFHLSALRLYNLEVFLKRGRQGQWNHARMATTTGTPAAEEQKSPATSLNLMIDTVEVHDGVIYFEDNLPEGGFRTVAREINIGVKNFSIAADQDIPFTLDLNTDRGETLNTSGNFLLKPFSLSLQTQLKKIQLGAYLPYYQDIYSKPFGGTLDLDTSLMSGPGQPLLLSDGNIAIHDFSAELNKNEAAQVGELSIEDVSFDMAKNRLEIDAVSTTDAKINFSRENTGAWSFLSQNFPVLHRSSGKEPPESDQQTAKKPRFSYLVGDVSISNWDIKVIDRLPATPVRIEVDDLELTASNLTTAKQAKTPFTLTMALQRKGRIDLQGTTSLADFQSSVKARLKNIPLADWAPYLAEQTNLALVDGFLNAQLTASTSTRAGSLATDFNGRLGINRLHLLDGLHQEDLLKWQSLQLAGIRGGTEPLNLAIESITLSDYFAKVLIDKEARLNLVEAFRRNVHPPADQEMATSEIDSIEADKALTQAEERPDISIDKVVLQSGQVDFTDRSLPRPFHANMRELGGRIDGLNSSADSRADVDLRGSLRSQSPLTISGTVNPLAERLFLDLELSFRDIEMGPFSPYSGTFAGYLIEKGKLNLALNYVIENNRLKASNKVMLDQFSFGDAVESEQATSLPVKLAVALLKDGNGEIHLDIPVYGNLDDPQFSIGGVIWTVIKNLLVKAATSPFALLGALADGGDEDFSNVIFDYGSAQLSASEQDKLKKVAEALTKRPSLEVEVSGFIAPEKDPEGYRRVQLASKIQRLKYLDLVKQKELPEGVKQEEIVVGEEEYADYLWQVYRDEDFPKPRNFIGMTKKLPPAEMEKLIYTNTPVNEDQLAELAQARALAVQNFLIEVGQLEQKRVFLKKPDVKAEPEDATVSRARVELGASIR